VRLTDDAHLRDSAFHLDALRYREHNLLVSAARRVRKRLDAGIDPFVAVTQIQNHLVALGKAHVDRTVVESFAAHAERAEPELKPALDRLRVLHALSLLHADAAWFLEDGYFERAKARAIRKLVERLSGEVRIESVSLVDAFGIPDDVLHAPIALEHYIDRAMPETGAHE
jgi:acyl-CoA oxidase